MNSTKTQRAPLLIAFPDELEHILRPSIERIALFLSIGGAVVDACHSCLVAGDVVEDGLNHMGEGAEFAQSGCSRSTEIMETPGANLGACLRYALVQCRLGLAPALKAAGTISKD